MTLSDYLSANKISYSEFARTLGVKNARTVERYAKRQRFPERLIMDKIRLATGGGVTANDFHADAIEANKDKEQAA